MNTKRLNIIIAAAIVVIITCRCDTLIPEDNNLSTEEVVLGLKEALRTGTDSATTTLHKLNGYYLDAAVKILLPDEAEKIRSTITNNNLAQYFNLDKEFEDVVISINRAAEDAAADASDIFIESITSLSISEAWDILNGINPSDSTNLKSGKDIDSLAATHYFQSATYSPLKILFSPIIDEALSKDLGLGFSANDAWKVLYTSYNNTYNTLNSNFITKTILTTANLQPLTTVSIADYSTEKALDGLFYKVGAEEKKIRRNPLNYLSEIIQKVFTYIESKL